jgi:hypothetical protein
MLDENRILEIARVAANDRGYAIYDDFNEALRREICHERWLEPTHVGWFLFTIKRVLVQAGWTFEKHRPARFYPPGSA